MSIMLLLLAAGVISNGGDTGSVDLLTLVDSLRHSTSTGTITTGVISSRRISYHFCLHS